MSSSTPSIRISQHQRYRSPPPCPSSPVGACPMAIPRAQEPVPPPLPPPSHIPEISAGHDPGWQWGNNPNRSDFGRSASVKPGSSLLGGALWNSRWEEERGLNLHDSRSETRRGSSISTVTAGRDQDMAEDNVVQRDEYGSSSRHPSNYRCVLPVDLWQVAYRQPRPPTAHRAQYGTSTFLTFFT